MVTPRSQRLTISKLVPTSSANFAWDHPLRLRACLKRSFGTRSSTLMMEAPSSQPVVASPVSFLSYRKDHGNGGTVMKNYPAGVGNLHEGGQLSPVPSTTITLYLNSAINKRNIGRKTQLVKHKSRNCQTKV